MMANLASEIFGIHAAALPLRQERLSVIASNIANADTPGYRARDIDFNAALEAAASRAMPEKERPVSSDPHHIDTPSAADKTRVYRTPSQPSLDGNTVDTNFEHAIFARAALEYRASLSFLEARVRNLLTAITGQ